MKISDEIVEKAAKAMLYDFEYDDGTYEAALSACRLDARAALLAVLPDIEKEIREECAKLADGYEDSYGQIANAIRSLPPSTQQEGK